METLGGRREGDENVKDAKRIQEMKY